MRVADQLWRRGYLWDVPQANLKELTADSTEVKAAVISFQLDHLNQYMEAIGSLLKEPPEMVGKIGKAVVAMLDTPTCCALPDVPPPPGANFAFDDPDIQMAIQSQQRSSEAGSGAWPHGCWKDEGYGNMHRLVVAVKHSSMPSHWKVEWPWLTQQCRINYSHTGLRIDFVDWDERADVRLQFKGGGRWIGLAEYPNGRCDDEVFCYLKPSYNPTDRAYRLNLLQHELGHNNKLHHVGSGIMEPVINRDDPDWRNDRHWNTLKGYYGGDGSPAILGIKEEEPKEPKEPADKTPVPTHGADALWYDKGTNRLRKIWIER